MADTSTITIAAVAKAAGVSRSTAGLVLNDRGKQLRIARKTELRVRQAAQDLGYRPNILARGLRGKRTSSVGILWSLSGPHDSAGMARALCRRIQTREHAAYLCDSRGEAELIERTLEDFLDRGVDGVVLRVTQEKEIGQGIVPLLKRFPAVTLVHPFPLDTEFDQVSQDYATPIRELMLYWHTSGRRRIGLVSRAGHPQLKVRHVEQMVSEFGGDPKRAIIPVTSRDVIATEAEMRAALQDHPGYDAMLFSSDEWAMVGAGILKKQGLVIPDDVAIAGFNDVPAAGLWQPPLASVNRCNEGLAETIVSALFRRLDLHSLPPQRLTSVLRYIHRESAG